MTPTKIIRQCCIITPREINERNGKLHAVLKIAEVIETANELAAKLEYPKDCLRYKQYSLDYLPMEAPVGEKSIDNLEEMMSRASAAGISAKYTYIINGEYDKDGKKIG